MTRSFAFAVLITLGAVIRAQGADLPALASTNASVAVLLREWGEDVHYSVTYDREHEEFSIIHARGAAAVPELMAALRRSTAESGVHGWTRDTAAWLLLELGPDAREAVPGLIPLLGHKNWNLRRWARVILGNIGSDASPAVPILLQSLKSKSVSDREAAANALGAIGVQADKVVPALMPLLSDPFEDVRRATAAALGRFGAQARPAVGRLLQMLGDRSTYVRNAVAGSIRRIAPEKTAVVDNELRAAADEDRRRYEATFRHDSGLRMEAAALTNQVEQGLPLAVAVSLVSEPNALPPGVKRLNSFLIGEFLTLGLTNRSTGKTSSLDIEPDTGPPFVDQGSNLELLDGRRLGPWRIGFRLVRLRKELEPGKYTCAVELAMPATQPKYWPSSAKKSWEKLGLWSGHIISSPFELEIVKEIPRKLRFSVPGHPHLERTASGQPRLVTKKEEASVVEVNVRNGFWTGTDFHAPTGGDTLTSPAANQPRQDQVFEIPATARRVVYRLTIFETSQPPGHMWHPGPGADDYKVLWKEWFETNLVSRLRN